VLWYKMKKYSSSWVRSTNRRKQRKYRLNAPGHVKQKLVTAKLDKSLATKEKKRSMKLRSGDEVVVMRGDFKKSRGKVTKIDRKKMKVYIEKVQKKTVAGQDKDVPVDPSNVKIVKLSDDRKRGTK
jgi:ribosomal protein uL24